VTLTLFGILSIIRFRSPLRVSVPDDLQYFLHFFVHACLCISLKVEPDGQPGIGRSQIKPSRGVFEGQPVGIIDLCFGKSSLEGCHNCVRIAHFNVRFPGRRLFQERPDEPREWLVIYREEVDPPDYGKNTLVAEPHVPEAVVAWDLNGKQGVLLPHLFLDKRVACPVNWFSLFIDSRQAPRRGHSRPTS